MDFRLFIRKHQTVSRVWTFLKVGWLSIYAHCLEYIQNKAKKMNLAVNWCAVNKIYLFGEWGGDGTFPALFSLGRFTDINFKCHCILKGDDFMFISWRSPISYYFLSLVLIFSVVFSNTDVVSDLVYITCIFSSPGLFWSYCFNAGYTSLNCVYLILTYLRFGLDTLSEILLLPSLHLWHPSSFVLSLIVLEFWREHL